MVYVKKVKVQKALPEYQQIKGYKPMTQDTHDQLVDAGFLG